MWYYSINGQQQGPVEEVALDRLIADGTVADDTFVWKEGLTEWTPLRQARALNGKPPLVEDAAASTCTICGKHVGADNLIDLLGHRVCANCKPMAVQTLREGAPLAATSGATAWRDGKKVVTNNLKSLPPRCYKCNQPTAEPPLKRKVYWHPPGYYLLILAGAIVHVGIILYIIVAMVVRKRATVEVCLCARHAQRRKYFIIGAWCGPFLGLAIAIAGIATSTTWLTLFGFLFLLLSVIVGLRGASLTRATKIKDDTVWLSGASKEFLASLPPWV